MIPKSKIETTTASSVLPPPANPFDGIHAIVPNGDPENPGFIRTKPEDPINFTPDDLRKLVNDRIEKSKKAKKELNMAFVTLHKRLERARRRRANNERLLDEAGKRRAAAAVECNNAQCALEGWWVSVEKSGLYDRASLQKMKNARSAALRRTKPVLKGKLLGAGKGKVKKSITHTTESGPVQVY
ncbi:hypothetical protein B0H10DRAFT_2206715 [Mycena sp. CBHHK59/15]|nr:hypothetical protein B0H10DRAFT_2206715 [Mycena sp. CBHHK59/15]